MGSYDYPSACKPLLWLNAPQCSQSFSPKNQASRASLEEKDSSVLDFTLLLPAEGGSGSIALVGSLNRFPAIKAMIGGRPIALITGG